MPPSQLPLPSIRRPTALVTGASSGIGLDLACVLAARGYDLVLVARSAETLEVVAAELSDRYGILAISLPADLRDWDAPTSLIAALNARGVTVNVLVNNAGFGLSGAFAETELETEREMIQVNVAALTALTKLVLPGMIARGQGRILNVASTAAFQPGPLMAVYYATKAYVLSFSQAIAEEVRNTGVTVTTLCPGPTHTRFASVAHMQNSNLFRYGLVMSSRDVAEYGVRAMLKGKRVAIPGVVNRLVAFGTRLVPRRMVTMLARMAQERR